MTTGFKFIPPFDVTDSALSVSNVYETVPTAYSGGTTYAAGDVVSVSGSANSHTVYKSLQDSNTGNAPASSPAWWDALGTVYGAYSGATAYVTDDIVTDTTNHLLYKAIQNSTGQALTNTDYWLEIGPSNRWAMFDQKSGTLTTWHDEVSATIDVTGRCTAVCLFSVSAASVNVTVNDSGGTERYNEDHSLVINDGIDDWYKYWTEAIGRRTDVYIGGLPNIANPEVNVTVTADGDVSVGNCVLGYASDIGGAQYGARVGIQDYSLIQENDFGVFGIVRRGYNKQGQFAIWIDADDTDYVYNLFATNRATPVVIVGSTQYTSTMLYGLLKDWSVVLQYPSHSVVDLQFQGL